jgi:antitoxin HicB
VGYWGYSGGLQPAWNDVRPSIKGLSFQGIESPSGRDFGRTGGEADLEVLYQTVHQSSRCSYCALHGGRVMNDREYTIVLQPLPEEDGGGYLAYVIDLKGCIGAGATQEEALADLRNAMDEWRDEAVRLNRQIPKPGTEVKKYKIRERELSSLVKAQSQLIDKQNDLLKTQEDALRLAQHEVEQIKIRLKKAQGEYESVWSGPAAQSVVLARSVKRMKERALPH